MKKITLAFLTILSTPVWASNTQTNQCDWTIAFPIFILVFMAATWLGIVRPKIKADKESQQEE